MQVIKVCPSGGGKMLCPSCNHENRAGRTFCVHCGARLELVCPSCGTSSEPGERFCGECRANPASLPKTSATPDPHAQRHIVNHAKWNNHVPEGKCDGSPSQVRKERRRSYRIPGLWRRATRHGADSGDTFACG